MTTLPLLLLQLTAVAIHSVKYRLEHEDVKVGFCDKRFIRNAQAKLFQYNGTSKAYNFSLSVIQNIPSDFKVNIESYKYQAKAYRKFPYEFAPKFCDLFVRNDFGIRMVYEYSNFRGCPIKANVTYYVANFILDDRKIPQQALIPGKFKLDGTIMNKTTTYAKFEWFVSIVRANN